VFLNNCGGKYKTNREIFLIMMTKIIRTDKQLIHEHGKQHAWHFLCIIVVPKTTLKISCRPRVSKPDTLSIFLQRPEVLASALCAFPHSLKNPPALYHLTGAP
jgi:hypothetical protein